MTTPVDEALEYLGRSDHRAYTLLVGGGSLFVTQYVFVWSGRAHLRGLLASVGLGRLADGIDLLASLVGLASLIVVLGYLTLVNRAVAAGDDTPPTFAPLTVSHWRTLLVRGVVAGVALGTTVVVLVRSLNTFVATVRSLSPPFTTEDVLVVYLYDLLTLVVVLVVFVYGPYVLLSVFLLLGRPRAGGKLARVLGFGNRNYLKGWGLMLVLLTLESDLLSYLNTLVTTGQLVQSRAGTDSLLGSFVTFYLLVSVVYLLSDALTDAGEEADE